MPSPNSPKPPVIETAGAGVREPKTAGRYDRAGRETHGEPNSTRTERSIDNLDDRAKPDAAPVNASAAPGGPGYGRKMPRAADERKIARTTDEISRDS
jgi:hypothetical protein